MKRKLHKPVNGIPRTPSYEILVNHRIKWRGRNLSRALSQLSRQYPHTHLTIRWIPGPELLVGEIHRGKPQPIKGVVPGAQAQVYIHQVRCRWNGRPFRMPVAIAETDDAPLIFGRVGALDRFLAAFVRGRDLRLTS